MRGRPCAAILATLLLIPAATAAQESRADTLFTVEKYLDYETVATPQISPDGSRIVYTRRWVNKQKDKWDSSLWIMNADGSRNRFLADGAGAVWSPDGSRIAYIADGEPEGPQVWVKYIDAEGATQVTRLTESPGDLRWSPDGRRLGFTMNVPTEASWKIDMPDAPEGAEWTKSPMVVDRIHYRADRRGYTKPGHTHLFLIDADGGTARQVTTGDWSVGARFDALPGSVSWDWMPDGNTIIVDGYDDDDADRNYRDAYIYAVDVQTGRRTRLTRERGTWEGPDVSPDGRTIAFAGTPHSTKSYEAADLYVMNADGSGARNLSATLDRDPSGITWAPDGKGIYFSAQNEGRMNVYFAPLNGAARPVTDGMQMLTLTGVARNGTAVGVRTTPHAPTDVVRFSIARPEQVTQLTRVNNDLLERVKLGEVEEMWYTAPDGTRVQGWLVKPPSFRAGQKYPLIMEIHGGPHGMYNVAFNPMFQNFAANGYVVLYTNPRGSTGYGTTFGNAIERAYPSVDYDDLMAGVDAAIAKGYVDADNMFVGGCSGGGVLSSWVIGHTDRFKAAAVRCPVTNWMSFLGQTDVPFFTHNFFDKPFWEDPEAWLKQSPLMYVGNVKTPTLIMTGVLDLRTPMPQSEEYYTALQMRGVPSTLLRFEGEYHGTSSKPSNWMRTQLYMMDWYKRYSTGGEESPRPTTP